MLRPVFCASVPVSRTGHLHALYQRIARRRGKPRAMMAVAHSLLVSIYSMLRDQVCYQELGPDSFDQLQAQHAGAPLCATMGGIGLSGNAHVSR
jgi:hypothetical protein